jgi:hypothetical protein
MPLVQDIRAVNRLGETGGLGEADLGQLPDLLQPGRQRLPVQNGDDGPPGFQDRHDDAGAAARQKPMTQPVLAIAPFWPGPRHPTAGRSKTVMPALRGRSFMV